jgi:predicted AlkP superfamily phosphohydrolase/phosphomutase
MKPTVIGIGLDSADPVLLEQWMSQGYLRNLRQLKQQGSYGYIKNTVNYAGVPTETCSTERLWTMTWTGCGPDKTGFWDTSKFYPDNYTISRDELEVGCNFNEYPPFYALGDSYKVAAFDLPATGLSEKVNGIQILAWGGHYPFTPSHSHPAHLLPDLIEQYGKNEVLYKDAGHWSNPTYGKWLYTALKKSVETRSVICRDLLKRDQWDLFLTAFPETHSGGHDLLHLSQPDHPVHGAYKRKVAPDYNPTLDVYEAVDCAVGDILAAVPDDAYILCFSIHGMGNNVTDLLSMAVLPELLYRFNFPGKVALAPGEVGVEPPPVITQMTRNSWSGEIWVKNYEPNPLWRSIKKGMPKRFLGDEHNGLASPWALGKKSVAASWMPAMWYSPLWTQMKAFALPAFADGHIRINLQGRERYGIVSPADYEALCEELTAILQQLKNARTGEPLVSKVVRTRRYPTEDQEGTRLPGPDLVVLWNKAGSPADVADSPDFGRIGPFPHARPGGHRSTGFLLAKGPGISPGSISPDAQGVDIAPTILKLLDAPIPDYLDGNPLPTILNAKETVEV